MRCCLKYPINVTIDTNIFDAAKYDFSENSTLKLLVKYVIKGKVKVVLSNIVIKEAEKHIAEQGMKLCGIARKLRTEALNVSTEQLINYVGLDRLLVLAGDKNLVKEKSIELFEKYIKDIDAEILDTSQININTIIDDYFEIRPPFQCGEKKRKEFPDAFIANQIRERFGSEEIVAIVCNDNGFKEACGRTPNHLFFESLGQLYNEISKEEHAYNETMDIIKELQYLISSEVTEYITQNENINVIGMSYDKDGISEGFDYSEVHLDSITNASFTVRSVDELTDMTSIFTIMCRANISANCYYDDYDNAPWDSEEKEYVYVETIGMKEEHHARFGCRIKLNRETKEISVIPFTIILGGDTRNKRYQIDDEPALDYEKDIIDADRKAIGLISLGSYDSYLEENLPDSEMSQEIVKRFEVMNALCQAFEEFSISYDSLLGELNEKDNAKKVIRLIAKKLEAISDFPSVIDEDEIDEQEIEEIKKWTDSKFENACKVADKPGLPDTISYGDSILIEGVDGSEMILCIDKLQINPSEGEEESIHIALSDGHEKIADGSVKLTIGYLNFDEDGGVEDGLADSIDYDYDQIIEVIDRFISEQTEQVGNEEKIIGIIKEAIG
ncbi:hypothetical protein SDC9_76195 [bioreactor metagenome]|uniref:DUF4935 domain-containing protein n=1 Tax=bioreactor metagenome TaxID=1076179 RepID=A0A644YM47_9ZZZZ